MFCTKPHIIFFVWSHSIKIPPIRNQITNITGDHLNTKAPPWSEPCSNKLPLCITLIWFDLLKSFPTPPKKRGVCNIYVLPCFSWLSSIPKHSMYGIVTKYSYYFYGACRKTYHILSVWDNRFRETSDIHRSSFLQFCFGPCFTGLISIRPAVHPHVASRQIRPEYLLGRSGETGRFKKKKNIAGWCCG